MRIDTDYHYISPYAVMILLSFLAGTWGMYILNRRTGIRKNIAGYLALLSPLMSLFGGICLTYITSGFQSYGLSSIGGLAGMYAAVLTIALLNTDRKQGAILFRNCTLVLPLMYGISKMGCFFAGCCYGKAYSGAFSVHYIGHGAVQGHDVFPVQLVETLAFLGIFTAGMLLEKCSVRHTVWIVFMLSAFVKGLLDFWRESHTGVLISVNQVLCMVLLVTGMLALYFTRRHLSEENGAAPGR